MTTLKLSRGVLVLGTFGLVACSGFEQAVQTQSALDRVNTGVKLDQSGRPICEVDYDEYELEGHVLGFEVHGERGVSLGFNLGGPLKFGGLSFKTIRGVMDMTLSLSETLRSQSFVAHGMGRGEMKKDQFSFELKIDQWSIGYDYFKRTPMAELSARTVRSALANLQSEFSKTQSPWMTKIAYASDGSAIVPVGRISGLQMGDRFRIHNVDYVWADASKPCESDLLMAVQTTQDPIAIGEVVQVEANASLLRLANVDVDEPLRIGARVMVDQLAGTPEQVRQRQLFRSARVKAVRSEPIVLTENQTVNIKEPVAEQIKALMSGHGFQPQR
jgi:hypothetical protein